MQNSLVLVGLRSAGKSTIGEPLAAKLGLKFIDADIAVAEYYQKQTGELIPFRELHEKIGADNFRKLVSTAIKDMCAGHEKILIAAGGGSLLVQENVDYFKAKGKIVFLDASYDLLLERWEKHPPKFIDQNNISQGLRDYYDNRRPLFKSISDFSVLVDGKSVDEIVAAVVAGL